MPFEDQERAEDIVEAAEAFVVNTPVFHTIQE